MIYTILYERFDAIIKIIMILAFLTSAVFAISLHEYAHGFAAYKMGDMTAKANGRLTINPAAHFEPIGFLMFLLVGFGFARPVPINPYNFKDIKKGLLITSLARVTANLIQAIVAFGLWVGIGYLLPVVVSIKALYYFLLYLFYVAFFSTLLNVALIAFNILPIYPLDGYNVVASLSRTNNAYLRFMRQYGSYILLGILLLGYFFDAIGLPQANLFRLYITGIQKGVYKLYYLIVGG